MKAIFSSQNKNTLLTNFILVIAFLNLIKVTNAQSRCASICQQDNDCKTGKCYLSDCNDSEFCFEFCFTCSGQKTCFATGISNYFFLLN